MIEVRGIRPIDGETVDGWGTRPVGDQKLIRKLRIGSVVCNSAVLTACRLPAASHVGQEAHMTADREVGAIYLRRYVRGWCYLFADRF